MKMEFSQWREMLWFLVINMAAVTSRTNQQYQKEVKRSTFDMEVIFILKQIKLIFKRKVMHLASF